MRFKYTFKTSTRALYTNRSRALLTILGIVIGITAIMIVMSLGQGAQDLILNQIQGLGSKTIVVIPGREPKGPADAAQVFSDSLRERDLELLSKKENVPTLKRIVPVVFGGATGSYSNETYRLTIFGASEEMAHIFQLVPDRGSFITADDVRARSSVVVIGSKVKHELFGDSDAVGEKIKIKNRTFTVVGVLAAKGQVSFFNFDEVAIVPYTVAQPYIFGIKHFHRFMIEAESEDLIAATVADVKTTLRVAHDIKNPDKDDFFVQTQADLAKTIGSITGVMKTFLLAVAAISLVVGGIGIMNIMLVTVTERTREIGLRKAVGATRRDILIQFLAEAIMLTGVGGIIGITLGTTLAFIGSQILARVIGSPWPYSFPLGATAISLCVSTAVGLIFGLYPARQAAKKSPIEALRYE